MLTRNIVGKFYEEATSWHSAFCADLWCSTANRAIFSQSGYGVKPLPAIVFLSPTRDVLQCVAGTSC